MRVSVHLLVPLCTSVLFAIMCTCHCICMCLYVSACVFVCIFMCVCMYRMCVCMYRMCVCMYRMYVCMYLYVCVFFRVFLSLQHHLFPPLKVVLVLKKEVVKSGGGEHEDSGRLP